MQQSSRQVMVSVVDELNWMIDRLERAKRSARLGIDDPLVNRLKATGDKDGTKQSGDAGADRVLSAVFESTR